MIETPPDQCEALRAFAIEIDRSAQSKKTKQVVVYVRCRKHETHPLGETLSARMHKTASPVSGKDVQWEDDYIHARYLEAED